MAPGPPRRPFTVAIIGGGVGGLTLAIGLLRRNISVQIYEAAPSFQKIGLGLSIGPAAHRALPLLDPRISTAYDKLITTHADSPGYEHLRQTWFEILWGSGGQSGELLMDLKAPPSGQTSLRRADFLDALVELVPPEITHFGKRLESLTEISSGVTLCFKDGGSASADVVIGCDGIKSKVKQAVVPQEYERLQPQYSGMYAYRAVLDMETMIEAVGERRARVASIYVGKGAYGITYPIARAQKANVGLFKKNDWWEGDDWIRQTPRAEMLKDFAHMGDNVSALMEHMHDSTQWAVFEHPPISTYAHSRIAILGDAAHASTPHQGAGAGQAIEDAHVLAECLADPAVTGSKDLIAALQAYDAIRRPRSQEVVASSKDSGNALCLCKEGIEDDGKKLRENLSERFRWLWDIDVQGQAEAARGKMMELREQGRP